MTTQTVSATHAVVQPASEARAVGGSRLLYVDNLRILLITMVIVIHVAVTYGVGGVWGYYQGPLAKAMADSSNVVYVLHPLVIVPLAIVLSPIKMEMALKFILVTPLAVALCFLVGYAVRKLPLVRNIL